MKNVYHTKLHMDPHLRLLMDTYDYESQLFRIDPRAQYRRQYGDQ